MALMKPKQRLDEETSFMLLEPGEHDTSAQALAGHLEEVSRSENSVVIVADRHGDLAGYVELAGGTCVVEPVHDARHHRCSGRSER
jgi:F420-0:gamma-glutamyl ligase